MERHPKMSSPIYENPGAAMEVRFRNEVREDGRVEQEVNISESVDAVRGRGNAEQHTGSQSPGLVVLKILVLVLVLVLVLLRLVAVIFLASRYSSLSKEKQQLEVELQELQEKQQLELQELQARLKLCDYREWERFGCSSYYKSVVRRSWKESEEECRRRRATLVIITSQDEQEFVSEMSKHNTSWIGLSRSLGTDGRYDWMWVDGTKPQFRAWSVGMNLQEGKANVAAYINRYGVWDWENQTGLHHWICEKPQVHCTESLTSTES